jgi:hypothetical protein
MEVKTGRTKEQKGRRAKEQHGKSGGWKAFPFEFMRSTMRRLRLSALLFFCSSGLVFSRRARHQRRRFAAGRLRSMVSGEQEELH